MTHVSAGATVALRAGATFMKDGSGMKIAAGAPLTIGVDGAGDLVTCKTETPSPRSTR